MTTYTVELMVRIALDGTNLVPTLEPPPQISVLADSTSELTWNLTTINDYTPDIATFGSSDGKLGLEPKGPIPPDVHPLVTGATATTFSIALTIDPAASEEIHYGVNFMFLGKDYAPDPIIVVTPEPVTSDIGLELASQSV